jgi:hypothetical protein
MPSVDLPESEVELEVEDEDEVKVEGDTCVVEAVSLAAVPVTD